MSPEPPETFSFGQTHEAMVAVGGEYFLVWSLRRRRQNEPCRVSALTIWAILFFHKQNWLREEDRLGDFPRTNRHKNHLWIVVVQVAA